MAVSLTACSGLRYASPDRPLYNGFAVEWTAPPAFDAAGAKQQLEEIVQPEANVSLLGMRPSVALHNTIKEPKKPKGIRHWLKHKLGTAPVYLDQVPLVDINAALVNRMNNRGYFAARSSYAVMPHGRKASVVFSVEPGPVHVIGSIAMGDPNATGLDSALAQQRAMCTVLAGEPYDLARLTAERARVSDRLRDQGWYRLRADDLIWTADTITKGKPITAHLRVKANTSNAKRMHYRIGEVTVHGDQDDVLPPKDTVIMDSMYYVNYMDMYRPRTVLRGVFVLPGSSYSLERTNAMQRYLTSYGVFRNVLVAYIDDSARSGVLNANVALLPMKQRSLFAEMNVVSKSNNFAGPGARVGLVDRDLFGGAEQFTLDMNGTYETQIAGEGKGTNAYQLGIKAAVAIPRRLIFGEPKGLRSSTPITNIGVGYGLYRRIGLYGMLSSTAAFGFNWHRERRVWHEVQLLEVSFNNLYYTSDDFNAFLAENPTIQRSFEDQFIVGFGYTMTRSTKNRDTQRDWLVYSLGFDESGNIPGAIQSIDRGTPSVNDPYTLFGQVYSQYVRLRPELRWYHKLGAHEGQLVTRLLTHAAIAYGNTHVVPYVKEFYAGGTNSLRGFRARSVGPGSYVSQQTDNLLVDQVGDLKLEFNTEYRFGLSGIFKGALFADAGNIWLLRDDPSRPGGVFNLDTFVSEIAMDIGLGLRIDPKVIVVRLDLATAIRRPDLPAGDRWVFDDYDQQWNRNLVLNIAIGYPF